MRLSLWDARYRNHWSRGSGEETQPAGTARIDRAMGLALLIQPQVSGGNTLATYGPRSMEIIAQLHPELQRWLALVIKHLDHSVVEGPRSRELQQHYFETGLSKVTGDQAKHCRTPCEAVHLVPFPWDSRKVKFDSPEGRERLTMFAGAALMIAQLYGIPIRWGGDWNLNWEPADNKFDDLMHFELGEKPAAESTEIDTTV